jgi:hypothetical protein
MTYEEVRARLAEDFGWSFDTIDDMSFEQINSAITRGEKSQGIPIESISDMDDINRNWRTYVGI